MADYQPYETSKKKKKKKAPPTVDGKDFTSTPEGLKKLHHLAVTGASGLAELYPDMPASKRAALQREARAWLQSTNYGVRQREKYGAYYKNGKLDRKALKADKAAGFVKTTSTKGKTVKRQVDPAASSRSDPSVNPAGVKAPEGKKWDYETGKGWIPIGRSDTSSAPATTTKAPTKAQARKNLRDSRRGRVTGGSKVPAKVLKPGYEQNKFLTEIALQQNAEAAKRLREGDPVVNERRAAALKEKGRTASPTPVSNKDTITKVAAWLTTSTPASPVKASGGFRGPVNVQPANLKDKKKKAYKGKYAPGR